MSLQQEIDAKRSSIKTDNYSMSISEWISLYESDELDVHPEFQRFFRWSPNQKTRLIESILLGIPIPPIFVSQKENGVWDVVDGLQRLSTIFEFAGVLKDKDGKFIPPLKLTGTKYLPSLDGMVWQNDESPDKAFDTTQRLLVRRARIDVNIILRESDRSSQYELFQRLNTGGSPLSDQEMRNALAIMVNPAWYEWFKNLSENENFQNVIALSERAKEEQYDKELVLRFLVFRTIEENKLRQVGDVGDYLTEGLRDIAENASFNFAGEERIFLKTFELLATQLEDRAFKKYHIAQDKFKGGFSVSAFEAIALGLGYNLENFPNANFANLEEKVKSIWSNQEFLENSGSGFRASQRIPYLIPIGRNIFSK